MTASLPPWLIRAVQIAVLAGLAVLLWRASDGWQAVARLRAADPIWLGAAVLALTAQTLLSALRWRLTAAQLGLRLAPDEAVREYYLAQVVNQSLPGGILGDAGRALRVRSQAGLLVSGQSVVFERLAGQIGLLGVMLLGLALTAVAPPVLPWPVWLKMPVALALTALLVLAVAAAIVLRRLPPDHSAKRGFARFATAICGPDVWARQLVLSLGTALCNIVAFALCAKAVGVAMPVLVVATLVPLILFAMVMPLSVAGWGLREGAAALLFPVFGAAISEGLATSIAFGLVFLMTVLPGLVFSWLGTANASNPTHASDS